VIRIDEEIGEAVTAVITIVTMEHCPTNSLYSHIGIAQRRSTGLLTVLK